MNRRDFLAKSAMAAAALVAVEGCGDGQIGPTVARPGSGDPNIPVSPGKTIRVADFPGLATVGTVVAIGNQRAVVRTANAPAAFRGLSMICTHEQCDTEVRNNRFECPCHGSRFANDGTVINGPNVANSGITPLRALTTSFNPTTGEVTVS